MIEVNPRFPEWSYFATGVGMNLPAQLIRRAFELPGPTQSTESYAPGKLFVRYSYELITDLAPFQALVTRGESL
jgi:carbamoyl-phosphate synthase large subunit